MGRRGRKSSILTSQRAEWLKLHEQGDSVPKIADKTGFDVRTVRTHLKLAQQERELAEAKSAVLRTAIEDHYADLLSYVRSLESDVGGFETTTRPDRIEYLEAALREHIPRSPIWSDLKRLVELAKSLEETKDTARKRVNKEVPMVPQFRELTADEKKTVILGATDALVVIINQMAQGYRTINLNDNFIQEPAGDDMVNLRYGAFQMGMLRSASVHLTRVGIRNLEKRILRWKEYTELQRLHAELGRVKKRLRDELAAIILRRIVPGHCRYCPFNP